MSVEFQPSTLIKFTISPRQYKELKEKMDNGHKLKFVLKEGGLELIADMPDKCLSE